MRSCFCFLVSYLTVTVKFLSDISSTCRDQRRTAVRTITLVLMVLLLLLRRDQEVRQSPNSRLKSENTPDETADMFQVQLCVTLCLFCQSRGRLSAAAPGGRTPAAPRGAPTGPSPRSRESKSSLTCLFNHLHSIDLNLSHFTRTVTMFQTNHFSL